MKILYCADAYRLASISGIDISTVLREISRLIFRFQHTGRSVCAYNLCVFVEGGRLTEIYGDSVYLISVVFMNVLYMLSIEHSTGWLIHVALSCLEN